MRKKLLFISPQLPYPLNVGSKIRIYNTLRIYATRYQVDMVYFKTGEDDASYASELNKYCGHIHTVSLPDNSLPSRSLGGAFSRLLSLLDPLPAAVRKCYSTEMVSVLNEINAGNYDIVHVGRMVLIPNVRHIVRKAQRTYTCILDLDDFESQKIKREFMLAVSLKDKARLYGEFIKWRWLERTLLCEFDCCLVCSEKDKQDIARSSCIKNAYVFANGVSAPAHPPAEILDDECTMLYLGSMAYEPNQDAVCYFIKEIYPLIKKKMPQARFIVAGKSSTRELAFLKERDDIILMGEVADAAAIMNKSTIFVVPLRLGGGTRIKILEAMSMAKAVVSTSIGCEGLAVEHGANIMVSDSPVDFADQCVMLLSDKGKRRNIGTQARELIRKKYMWQDIGERYLDFLHMAFDSDAAHS